MYRRWYINKKHCQCVIKHILNYIYLITTKRLHKVIFVNVVMKFISNYKLV